MTDIRVGYTTSDYFYTLEPEKIPSHQTCEAQYNIEVDASCSLLPNEIRRCFLLDFTNQSGRENCLRDIDEGNDNKTQYYEQYKKWINTDSNCYTAALCKNRKYAEKIQEQQTRHLGTEQNHENMQSLLTNEQWKSIQLGIGIVGILGGIYLLNKRTVSPI